MNSIIRFLDYEHHIRFPAAPLPESATVTTLPIVRVERGERPMSDYLRERKAHDRLRARRIQIRER